jgi:hypothetical protein
MREERRRRVRRLKTAPAVGVSGYGSGQLVPLRGRGQLKVDHRDRARLVEVSGY